MRLLLVLALCCASILASIDDDLLSKPHFELQFAGSTLTSDEAQAIRSSLQTDYKYRVLNNGSSTFLCAVPNVTHTRDIPSAEERLKLADEAKEESLRATTRGQELLKGISGTCLYRISGWWTYKFCYGEMITQFRALPHSPGAPMWPPRPDPNAGIYSLGKWIGDSESGLKREGSTDFQANGDHKSLVMHYVKGSYCPLIGGERKTEVQFQCSPTTDDRIVSVKEVTSCQYLIVVHTARLCHDVAFQAPNREKSNEIVCTRISDEKPGPSLGAIDGGSNTAVQEIPSVEAESSILLQSEAEEDTLDSKVDLELAHLAFEDIPEELVALASTNPAKVEQPSPNRDVESSASLDHGVSEPERLKVSLAEEMALNIASQLKDGSMTMDGESIFDMQNEHVEFDVELQDENGELVGNAVMKVVDGEVVIDMQGMAGNEMAGESKPEGNSQNANAQRHIPPHMQAFFERFVRGQD